MNVKPNDVNVSGNKFRVGYPASAGISQRQANLPTKAARARLLVGILWVMILPIAVACVAGCIGSASSKSATALNAASPSASSLRIATNALPVGAVQSSYGTTLVATGGVPPYTWSQTGGQLPGGLSLNSASGAISGTPTGAGSFSFATKVVDSKAHSATTDFSLNVSTCTGPNGFGGFTQQRLD